MKKVLAALAVVIVLAAVAGVGAFVVMEGAVNKAVAAPGAPVVEFTVPKGTSGRGLGGLLVTQGLLSDTRVWRYHLFRRGGFSPKAGRHPVSPSMTVAELAKALEGNPLPDDIPFVVVEGWRLRDTDAALVAANLIKPGEYIAAASNPSRFKAPFPLPVTTLEGYLYPETYGIIPGDVDVEDLIQRQLDAFAARFYTPNKDAIARSGRSLHEVVVMASMLEREEPVPAQRPLVAGILWKRVDKGFPLGVDATSRYVLAQWNDRKEFLKRLRDPEDPYNTRHRKGLPPGPIGAPTVESLQAAMAPKPSEFWYYLHDAQKNLHPSRNADEHEALRKKYNVY
ncbi:MULTISPECIES: endolytic transglycosylase MltG [Myxococcus]|uniref:endolytic transglycosylase MltG n=1 Tax=Myxococcus TaxID=32 RepID=UPI001142B009|nr:MULTISPECIES: endolytic transglycosylase MltG [Myxococcus]MBZ4398244.1 endolytic transglycosylase MltG [Myxococcus sp. AS-1-15]MCK8499347.1 endolytic transglycosylase MltG [Myxococcus fulvus]BDT35178.1 endolytic transglycosylase MltG [Myxococcus sp. MH1]